MLFPSRYPPTQDIPLVEVTEQWLIFRGFSYRLWPIARHGDASLTDRRSARLSVMGCIGMVCGALVSILHGAVARRETNPAVALGQSASTPQHIWSARQRRIEEPHCHHTPRSLFALHATLIRWSVAPAAHRLATAARQSTSPVGSVATARKRSKPVRPEAAQNQIKGWPVEKAEFGSNSLPSSSKG
jgi:hypothetical protein